MYDTKFSFGQLTSNKDGKTSGSGTMGILICTVGALSFFLGAIFKLEYTLVHSIVMTTIGATLLGYRKSKAGGSIEKKEIEKEI